MNLNARNVSVTVALAATLCAVPGVALADTAAEGEAPALTEGQVSSDEQPSADATPVTEQAPVAEQAAAAESAPTTPAAPAAPEAPEVPAAPERAVPAEPAAQAPAEKAVEPATGADARDSGATAPEAPAETASVDVDADGADKTAPDATPAEAQASAPAAAADADAPAAADKEPVLIADANLRAVIEKTLGKRAGEAITAADLATLREVDAHDAGLKGNKVRSIAGLEHARNLEVLNLNENSVSDLTPLEHLTRLRELRLVRNEVSDLTPIAHLTDLRVLDIYYNHVTDISVLSNFHDLEYLDMHACNRTEAIGSIEPLAHLTKLRYLSIESNHIRDISCLADVAQAMADAVTGEPSDNPPTFLVRVNHITDLSVLRPLLDKKYVELDGIFEGNEIEKKVVVGTINQSVDPVEVTVPSDGGEVLVRLPTIRGFEDVDAAIASMFGVDTVRVAALENAPDGYELTSADGGNATLRVPANVVGAVRDEVVNVYLTYEGTDFLFVQPVHVRQRSRYLFALDAAGDGGLVSFAQDAGEPSANRTVRATVFDADGNPVDLEDVTVTFEGKARMGASQEAFRAQGLRLERDGFSFELAKAPGEGALGAYELVPHISFRVRGDTTTFSVPTDGFTLKNVVIRQARAGEPPADELVARVVFDLAKRGEDGRYASEAIDLALPFDAGVVAHYLVALDAAGEQIGGTTVVDGKATLTLTREQIRQLVGLKLMVTNASRGGAGGAGAGVAGAGGTAGAAASPSTSYLFPRLELVVKRLKNAWVAGPSMPGWTEGEREASPTATAQAGAVSFRYYDADGNELPGRPHAAGRYFVRAFAAGDDDHDPLESEPLAFVIAPHAGEPVQPAEPEAGTEEAQAGAEKDGEVASGTVHTASAGYRREPAHLAAQESVPATGDRTEQAAVGATLAGGVLAILAGLLGRRRGARDGR